MVILDVNKNVIDEIADLRKEAVGLMTVYDQLISEKLKKVELFEYNQIEIVSDHDPTVIITIARTDDHSVEMTARINEEQAPPGIVDLISS